MVELLLEEEKYIVDIDKDNLDNLKINIWKILRLVNNNGEKIYLTILDIKVIGMIVSNIIKQTKKNKLRKKDVLIYELLEISISKKYQSIGMVNY